MLERTGDQLFKGYEGWHGYDKLLKRIYLQEFDAETIVKYMRRAMSTL